MTGGMIWPLTGEDAARHDVADRRAGDQAVQCRRHHGHFGRAAAQVSQQRKAHLHHVVAAARAIEQCAEQHEHEDEADRHSKRDAEHAFGHHPHVRHDARNRRALVRDDVGQVGARHHVPQEEHRQHRHWQANGAPRCLEQQQHADRSDDDVERRRIARPKRQLAIEDDQVERRRRTDDGHHPVLPRHIVAWRPLERRKRKKREEQANRQVDRARLGVVEDAKAQRKRQR
jgi:hypothetical protein